MAALKKPHWEVVPPLVRDLLADIGQEPFARRMKLDAIATRGARKDFYDVYFIAREVPIDKLLERGAAKYPHVRDFGMMVLTGMVDFNVADQQAPVESIPPVPWETVKEFFLQEMRRIGRMWFESDAPDDV